jgi:hypothetical protein
MFHSDDYLANFRDMQMNQLFEKVNGMFCDGIILPRLPQLFVTYKDIEVAFHAAGIQV